MPTPLGLIWTDESRSAEEQRAEWEQTLETRKQQALARLEKSRQQVEEVAQFEKGCKERLRIAHEIREELKMKQIEENFTLSDMGGPNAHVTVL